MPLVYLGIGSNLGDRQANIDKALALLKENKEIQVQTVSALIEPDPEGEARLPAVGQGLQEKFLNGAIKIDTDLLPLELLSQLKMIERRLGRSKSPPHASRSMDLDILFYGDVVILEGKTLSIPHPRLAQRKFVLQPLLEIAPDLVHPKLKKTIKQLYEQLCHDPTTFL